MKDKKIADAFASFAPSEEQKERIYGKVASGRVDRKVKRGKIAFAFAVVCIVLMVAAAILLNGPGRPDGTAVAESGGSQTGQTASSGAPVSAVCDTVFSGFVFTAYRPAEGAEYLGADYEQEAEQVALKPDVKVLLARYSPLMSSVPGLPFMIGLPDGSDGSGLIIRVTVDGGALCEWNQSTGIVTQKGISAEIVAGGTIYWNPFGEEGADITQVNMTVEAVADGVVVGTQRIVITRDEQGYYYATAGEPETI